MNIQNEKFKKNIILVGNACEIIDKSYGRYINDFDEVVRMNRFLIDGFEDSVGTKITTHLAHHHYCNELIDSLNSGTNILI